MPNNPMADFVDAIHEFWWQSKTPPIANHDISKDLSVVKAWLKQGWSRNELLGGMKLYEGNPVTLLVTYKRGNRNIINELVGNFKKAQELKGSKVGNILHQMARENII
ncbi:MAG: hypothetical protein KAJ55_00140 [Anaerolineales bacterium]|nr:hypothetical protein [Anaerolineales bacterium]